MGPIGSGLERAIAGRGHGAGGRLGAIWISALVAVKYFVLQS
jgi:hypothetical protein